MQYVSNVLGIKDPIHKQKLALKAMDVVLFGPPKGLCIKYLIDYKTNMLSTVYKHIDDYSASLVNL